jgi:hypothetical protein
VRKPIPDLLVGEMLTEFGGSHLPAFRWVGSCRSASNLLQVYPEPKAAGTGWRIATNDSNTKGR